jgi:hypothetical protein
MAQAAQSRVHHLADLCRSLDTHLASGREAQLRRLVTDLLERSYPSAASRLAEDLGEHGLHRRMIATFADTWGFRRRHGPADHDRDGLVNRRPRPLRSGPSAGGQ